MTGGVFGLGEILWDLLPSGPQLGGAPANFALHAAALGAPAGLVTRIGADARGDLARQRLLERHLPGDLVQVDPALPTGTVIVSLSGAGLPAYQIEAPAAWDRIEPAPAALAAMASAAAVCFGSLAQRAPASRAAIQTLVAATPPAAWRIFDVNLRQQYYDGPLIEESLRLANVVKLNDSELPLVGDLLGVTGTPMQRMQGLAARFQLRLVALTRGADGSLLLADGRWSDRPGYPVALADTVGAGDAFTAALCVGLLRGIDIDRVNDAANRIAALVCGSHGATPPLSAEWVHRSLTVT